MAVFTGDIGAFYAPRRQCVLCGAGVDDAISIADDAQLELIANQDMTWQILFRVTATPAAASVLLYKDDGTDGYQLYMDNAGLLIFSINIGGFFSPVPSVNRYDDGEWHMVQCIRDVTNTKVWLYVDGIADPVGGSAGDNSAAPSAVAVTLGGDAAAGCTVDTYIGETVFWQDKALSAAECLAAWNGGVAPWVETDSEITGLWQMREGAGATVADLTTNARNGTLINTAAWDTAGIVETAEAVGNGDGVTTVFALDYPNVDDVTMYVTAVEVTEFDVTVKGAVTFGTAPAGAAAITADYTRYLLSQTGGFYKWAITIAADIYDKTDFRSVAGWKEKGAALLGWTGGADRHWIHPGFAREAGDRFIVKFYETEAGDRRWEGWTIMEGVTDTVEVSTLIEEAVTFAGTDVLNFET